MRIPLPICAFILASSLQAQNPCDDLDASFFYTTLGNTVLFQAGTYDAQWFYLWDFGDGTTGNGPSQTHVYPGPTLFQPCLTVWAWDPILQDTCFATSCQIIDLTGGEAQCDSTFSVDITWFEQGGGIIVFQATGSLPANGFLWDFGDGAPGFGAVTQHVYQPGSYQVCVNGWYWNGQDSCWAEHCDWINVGGGGDPCAGLDASFFYTTMGNTVLFQAGTYDAQWFYLWDFGDGTTGNGPSQTHVYPGPTLFQPCLTVWAWDPMLQDTCFATSCQIIDLTGGEAQCDSTFSVNLTWFEQGGGIIVFQATGSLPANGFLWDFGDGAPGFGAVTQHVYQPGSYQICVNGWYWNGQDSCWAEHCDWITVGGGGSPCDSLEAAFTFTTDGNTVTFVAEDLDVIWGYSWDFGDGNQATGPVATHTYPGPTIFQACLTIWTWNPQTEDLCYVTSCHIIDLTQSGIPCDSTFTAQFAWSSNGPSVNFIAASTPSASGFIWDFGDGFAAGYGQTAGHLYQPPGPFLVCLSAWYWSGTDTCWTSTCEEVDPFFMSAQELEVDDLKWTTWPNPASGQLFVQSTGVLPTSSTLRLFAADGREVRLERPTGWPHALDVQGLAPGLYLLRLDGLQGGATQRVVVE